MGSDKSVAKIYRLVLIIGYTKIYRGPTKNVDSEKYVGRNPPW